MSVLTLYNWSPRLYKRYQRHADSARFRYSNQERTFLTVHATRLSSTVAVLEAKLNTYTADQIAAAASMGDLR